MDRINYNQEEEDDKLQIFLFNMIEEEISFIKQARQQGYQLDEEHPLTSLTELERYVLEKGINFQGSSDEAMHHRSLCWYYLGEVVRENYGGYWKFSMSEDNTMHWGLYVIDGFTRIQGLEFEPLGSLKRFIRKRNPGAFLREIESLVNPKPVDFSEFPDEPEFVE
ncbi:hypothetical protein [Hymenobacter terrenus]|uniref:hypothetical protein n=1 Tax=Hymenobacter terrenus TaxID=1629124 RepID=UPI000619C72E|nr:hypothetical protein [Hymenobacter terrenus]